jgi:DNA-binding HxlR family transcriptional regulator
MQRTDLAETFCPAARALACVGEWWSLLILRDVFQGLRRFDEIRDSLGISTNILARRLRHLTDHGILARRLYQQRPARYEYVATEKGRELLPLLLLLYRWGNAYEAPEGIAVELADRTTGHALDPVVVDRQSGKLLMLEQVKLRTGPAATPAAIERVELIAMLRARSAQTKSAKALPAKAHATKTHPVKTRKQPAASSAGDQHKHRKRASS